MARSSMVRRSQRRTPATIVAVLVAAAGFVAAWVGIEGLITGRVPTWLGWLPQRGESTTWAAPTMIVAAILLALIGLTLIICAVKPGKRSALVIIPPGDLDDGAREDVALSRSGLAKIVGARAELVDGVDSVAVRAESGAVRIAVTTTAADPGAVRSAVTDQVRDRLRDIGFSKLPKVSTKVRQAK